jgi:hypothetical protein
MHSPETKTAREPARASLLKHAAVEIGIVPECRPDLSGIRFHLVVLVVVVGERKLPCVNERVEVAVASLDLHAGSTRRQEDHFRLLFARVEWDAVLAVVVAEVGAEPPFAEVTETA